MKTVRPPFDAQGLTERLEGRLKTLDADGLKSVATRMMETMRNDPRWRVTNGTADVLYPKTATPYSTGASVDPHVLLDGSGAWEALELVARLIVVQHLLELKRPVVVARLTPERRAEAGSRHAGDGMEITFCGVPVRFESIDGPRDVVAVLEDLPEDLNAEWSTPPWTQDVMTAKLMIELAGLDAHDLDAVEAYSRSQHDFVLSCLALSMSEERRAEADCLPDVLGFGRVDLFFNELMRDCHATGVHGVTAVGENLAAVGSTRTKDVDGPHDGVEEPTPCDHDHVVGDGLADGGRPSGSGKDSMLLRLLLVRAVYGACRFRRCEGLYDADQLSCRLGCGLPLSLRPPKSRRGDASGALDDSWHEWHGRSMESLFYDFSVDEEQDLFTRGFPRWMALDAKKTHVKRRIGQAGHGDEIESSDDALLRLSDGEWVGRVKRDDTCLESSVLTMIPEDLRPACTMGRLRRIEARTHLVRERLVMGMLRHTEPRAADLLRRTAWHGPDSRRRALQSNMRRVLDWMWMNMRKDGKLTSMITRDEMPRLLGAGYSAVDYRFIDQFVNTVCAATTLDRFMDGVDEIRSASPGRYDPFGGMGLLDIVLSLTMLCALNDRWFTGEIVPIGDDDPRYGLLDECTGVFFGVFGESGNKGVDLEELIFKSPGDHASSVMDAYDGCMTVMTDVVMRMTAVALGSIGGCEDLPKEFVLEDLKMRAVSGFEDAMESNLGVGV